jgi:hypothetical protein
VLRDMEGLSLWTRDRIQNTVELSDNGALNLTGFPCMSHAFQVDTTSLSTADSRISRSISYSPHRNVMSAARAASWTIQTRWYQGFLRR